MNYRKDNRSKRQLSALGFGCMRLPKLADSEKLILRAIEDGINYFDTAYAYPGNEEMLGKIIAKHNLRDRLFIATKLPQAKVHSQSDIDKFFETSLKRLQTDHVEYYLMHNVVSFAQWENLVACGIKEWIDLKKTNGAIENIGFSFHGALPEFKKILDAYDWDFVQIQYNFVNEHYQAGRDGLDMAQERGLTVIIMEPLLGGKLADGMPKEAQRVLKKADPHASIASWGLRWLWNQPGVTCVLSGMNSMEQLEDNVRVASISLPNCMSINEQAIINDCKREFQKSFKVPCTGCNYCMPCPKGINIPAAFAAYNESFAISRFTGIFHHMMSAGIQSEDPHWLNSCINCGKCEKACPQNISIPAEFAAVKRRVEPSIVYPISKLVPFFF